MGGVDAEVGIVVSNGPEMPVFTCVGPKEKIQSRLTGNMAPML